jgi:hypothetical protein
MTELPGRRPRVKLSPDELLRRLRLGELRKLLRDRCGSVLPDDDAGREYLRKLLLPISLGPYEAIRRPGATQLWGPTDRMRAEIERWAPWMSEDEARELRLDINAMPMWQRKPMASTVGERLNVPYAERARLGLRTIGPCDMTEAAMALIRKQKKRQRDKLRRQLQGQQSRADYLAAHNKSKEQPWVEKGISRRTYYYRIKQEQANCTGPRQVNFIKTELALVQKEKNGSNAGECERPPTPTPAGLTDTSVNDGFLTADEAAWLVDAICPPEYPPDLEAAA